MITCKDQTILFIWFAVVYTMQCVGMIVSSTDTDKINKVCPGYEGFCCADRCPWKELRGKHCQQQPQHFDMKHNERPPDRVHPVHALHRQWQLHRLGSWQRHQLHHQVDFVHLCCKQCWSWTETMECLVQQAWVTNNTQKLSYVLLFSMELRDTGLYGFLLPADQIIPTSEETW